MLYCSVDRKRWRQEGRWGKGDKRRERGGRGEGGEKGEGRESVQGFRGAICSHTNFEVDALVQVSHGGEPMPGSVPVQLRVGRERQQVLKAGGARAKPGLTSSPLTILFLSQDR